MSEKICLVFAFKYSSKTHKYKGAEEWNRMAEYC